MMSSNCPVRSAEAIDDASLDKMLSKASKLLTMALLKHGEKIDPKQSKYVKSDFADWTSANYKNYMWMLDFFMSLKDEREIRFPEASEPKEWKQLIFFVHLRGKIPRVREKRDEFPNITEFKELTPVVAYRKWMEETWNNAEEIPEWTNRGIPVWSWRYDNNLDSIDETSYNYLEV